ncbi:MAG: hypothetical protein WDM90_11445 [Ferruginibacter sp.]
MTTFNEVQKFRVRWAWLAVIAMNVLFIYAIIQQIIIGKPFGPKPAPSFVLIIVEAFLLGLLFFISSIKLITVYDSLGIQYKFSPFQFKFKTIAWHDLQDAYIRQYNSFFEYGGYGMRYGTAKIGNAINTSQSCNKGLQLRFKNGKLLLIGTKDPTAIQKILDEAIIAGKINRIY